MQSVLRRLGDRGEREVIFTNCRAQHDGTIRQVYVSTSPNLSHQRELVSNSYTDIGGGGREGNFHITSSDCRSLQLMSKILNVVDWKDKMREVCPIRKSVLFVP